MWLNLEQLEDRCVPSVTLTNGHLNIVNDQGLGISAGVSQANGSSQISVSVDEQDGTGSHSYCYDVAKVKEIDFTGGAGDWNVFVNVTAINCVATGGTDDGGNSDLEGGSGTNYLYGEAGTNYLFAGTGTYSELHAGGDKNFLYAGSCHQTEEYGTGDDTFFHGTASSPDSTSFADIYLNGASSDYIYLDTLSSRDNIYP